MHCPVAMRWRARPRRAILAALFIPLFLCAWRFPWPSRPAEPTGRPPPAAAASMPFLRVDGRRIVDEDGREVRLRGCNAGGWLLIEPWILGIEGGEEMGEKELWDILRARLGDEKTLELIKYHRENFFTEDDVRRIAQAGMNCLRIPVWWRAVEDPRYGGDIGYLDRCLEWCRRNGVYAIIDLHGAPGAQSIFAKIAGEGGGAALWKDEAHRQHAVDWWTRIAARYAGNPTVAAYDILNEAIDAPYDDIIALNDRLYRAIRAVDPRHIIVIQDALLGLHRLPLPAEMGWEDVVYSFHYYPGTGEDSRDAPARTLHRFQRAALYYGVPLYVGEFNTIDLERGGAESFLRFCEVFDYYGWPWTFWTYKMIGDSRDVTWGPCGLCPRQLVVDLHAGSLESIQAAFAAMRSEATEVRPLLRTALEVPVRWAQEPAAEAGTVILDLRQALVLPAEAGTLGVEWAWSEPNVGYWLAGDTVAWIADVPAAATYQVSLTMANASGDNRAAVWVDGVHVTDAALGNTGGWRLYREEPIARVALGAGRHVIEIGQADTNSAFINLRQLVLRPAPGPAGEGDENTIWLKPANMAPLPKGSPVRIEWLRDPPDIGFWRSSDGVPWDIVLTHGGDYKADMFYSSPHIATRFRLEADGQPGPVVDLPGTGAWHDFNTVSCGRLSLGPGRHRIEAFWETDDPAGAGNLRAIRLVRP